MSKAWDIDLPATDKLVLLALADWSNDTGHCWPSIRQLCVKCGLTDRGVQKCLARLEAGGHIERNMVSGKGTNYDVHPRTTFTTTPEQDSPRTTFPPNESAQTPEPRSDNTLRTTIPKKDKPSLVRAKHSLPDDWQPKEFGIDTQSRKAVDGWPPGELERQLEHFRAHHTKAGSKWSDWQAAWSTWVLNQRRFSGHGQGNHNRPSGWQTAYHANADQ
jgi:hypothetical protein